MIIDFVLFSQIGPDHFRHKLISSERPHAGTTNWLLLFKEASHSLQMGVGLPSENPVGGPDIITEGEEGVPAAPPSLR